MEANDARGLCVRSTHYELLIATKTRHGRRMCMEEGCAWKEDVLTTHDELANATRESERTMTHLLMTYYRSRIPNCDGSRRWEKDTLTQKPCSLPTYSLPSTAMESANQNASATTSKKLRQGSSSSLVLLLTQSLPSPSTRVWCLALEWLSVVDDE